MDAESGTGRAFVKMHGLKNHFVIVDARVAPYRPAAAEIARICDVDVGVGADQLVVIEPSARADVFMRLYNVDGREVEACGNATRCVAWIALEETGGDHVRIETLAGVLECRRIGERQVSCDMGRVSMDWQDVPLSEERDTLNLGLNVGPLVNPAALSVGNPHAVFFVDDVDAIDVAGLAPTVQGDRLFPHSVNVGVATLRSADRLQLIVYERGAGLTQACGTGACAAAFAARARGLTEATQLTVELPAGEVGIEIRSDGHAVMSGPVAYCFRGIL
ncbi:Diaminopimelate epimerase [Planctomycetes bacterium Poly30]|uniref:Diaminopimelate epimerase n=2 Tax=Saltatorellus ferox TaxID=2528018 RepID=A0A518ET08_9BACT|nr:Diaminopimelate epimerase [Planctomycetes bacterium Poly30]